MFSLQSAQAIAMMNVDEQTASALQALLGDCSQPLEHRAPVTIEGQPEVNVQPLTVNNFLNNITDEITNNNFDQYVAMLTVNNTLSNITNHNVFNNEPTINNNFSIMAPGVSYIQYLTADEIHATQINYNGYCWADKLVVTDVRLSYSFDSATCALTLTQEVDKDTIRVLVTCEEEPTSRSPGSQPGSPGTSPSQRPTTPTQTTNQSQMLYRRRQSS